MEFSGQGLGPVEVDGVYVIASKEMRFLLQSLCHHIVPRLPLYISRFQTQAEEKMQFRVCKMKAQYPEQGSHRMAVSAPTAGICAVVPRAVSPSPSPQALSTVQVLQVRAGWS